LWLEQMLARKPRMLAPSLANKTARIIWRYCKEGKLQSSGRTRRESGGPEVVAGVVGRRRVWRNSRRDGRKNQMYSSCLEHAFMICPVTNSMARSSIKHQRPDRWQHPTTCQLQNRFWRGVHR
jgi:hypothetical protein